MPGTAAGLEGFFWNLDMSISIVLTRKERKRRFLCARSLKAVCSCETIQFEQGFNGMSFRLVKVSPRNM